MAQINITTTEDEQERVLATLRKHKSKTVSVSALATELRMNQSRVRYTIMDLVDIGKVKKVPTRAINEHYIRYKYEVVE